MLLMSCAFLIIITHVNSAADFEIPSSSAGRICFSREKRRLANALLRALRWHKCHGFLSARWWWKVILLDRVNANGAAPGVTICAAETVMDAVEGYINFALNSPTV